MAVLCLNDKNALYFWYSFAFLEYSKYKFETTNKKVFSFIVFIKDSDQKIIKINKKLLEQKITPTIINHTVIPENEELYQRIVEGKL